MVTLLLAATAAAAGCATVRENAQPAGSDVNNDAGPSADYNQTEVGPGGCIASTTGEPTSGDGTNPCPRGQVPRIGSS